MDRETLVAALQRIPIGEAIEITTGNYSWKDKAVKKSVYKTRAEEYIKQFNDYISQDHTDKIYTLLADLSDDDLEVLKYILIMAGK